MRFRDRGDFRKRILEDPVREVLLLELGFISELTVALLDTETIDIPSPGRIIPLLVSLGLTETLPHGT